MMNVDEYKLPLKKVIEEFELEKIYETDDLDSVMITNTDVNRPGLQMVGFFDYFDNNRIQIMGKVEFTYLEQFHADERAEKIEKLMSQHIPALIVTRGLQIFPEMIELAEKYNVPLLRSERRYFGIYEVRLSRILMYSLHQDVHVTVCLSKYTARVF